MEALVTIIAVGAYAERQYQRQDGTPEYFKSRGVTMKRGGDVIYGEMTGELASDSTWRRDSGSIARGRTRTARNVMRTHSILLTFKCCKYGILLSRKYSFLSGYPV